MHAKRIGAALVVATVGLMVLPALAQESPPHMASAYSRLADALLALRAAEADLVHALLDQHGLAAEQYFRAGDFERAAAEMVLFANEGDNTIGGIRKRLLDGGHHHNADAERQGIYEPGFVIVTREAKQQILQAAAAVRRGASDEERTGAWERFQRVADELLGTE